MSDHVFLGDAPVLAGADHHRFVEIVLFEQASNRRTRLDVPFLLGFLWRLVCGLGFFGLFFVRTWFRRRGTLAFLRRLPGGMRQAFAAKVLVTLVGAALAGRVLIVDDVITAGTAIREAIGIIESHGAKPVGVAIAVDRQERGQGSLSAVQELKQSLGIPVSSIIQLNDLIDILEESEEYAEYLDPVVEYRRQYGVLS